MSPPATTRPPRTVVFTIVSRNYLAYARVLMKTLARVSPDWDRVVLLTDRCDGAFDPDSEGFRVVEAQSLPVPEPQKFFFRYTIVELNTAVKPWFFRELFGRGYERVVYLDPDIYVYRHLGDVERALAQGGLAVLVPHVTGRLTDDAKPTEHDILQSGAYNLGFCALARHPHLDRLLEFWCEKSLRGFVVDLQRGLFTDQRWMDLVPGMFPDVTILRHEGYDVAYWNLPHRRLTVDQDTVRVNDVPLVFFHFSGIDPANPRTFSRHQNRYRLDNVEPIVRELTRRYCAEVVDAGFGECRKLAYAYGVLRDGSPIPDVFRRLYRTMPEVETWAGDDPFARTAEDWTEPLDGRSPPLSRAMLAVYHARPDVRLTWPDASGVDREAFARWYAETPELPSLIPECYIEPARRALARSPASPANRRRPARQPGLSLRPAVVAGALRKARVAAAEGRLPLSPRRWLELFRLHVTELAQADLAASAPPQAPPDWTRRGSARISASGFSGFHPQSPHEAQLGAAWMSLSAEISLAGCRTGAPFEIEGEHYSDLHASAGRRSVAVLVEVDGRPVATMTASVAGRFTVGGTLPATMDARSALMLRASHAVVPAQVGAGSDERALSVQVRQVRVDGQPVLDFAKPEPYSVPPGTTGAGPSLTVVGYFSHATGVAAAAHASLDACAAAGITVDRIDAPPASPRRGLYSVNLLHVNADQTPLVARALGGEFFENRHTIGLWNWELEEFPDAFTGAFDWVDEVWAPSRFVQQAVSEKSPVPVVCVPHPVTVVPTIGLTRKDFGLPEDRFLFLVMYDALSVQERKNPLGALAAYRLAFPRADDVSIVIRVNHAASRPDDVSLVRSAVRDVPGAFLIDGPLSRSDAQALQVCCDAFVSLHRSEGFGLNIAEAMLLGKPVVVTGWSGNLDFTRPTNAGLVDYSMETLARDWGPYRVGQRWAAPDTSHAADLMRRLVGDAAHRQQLATRGRSTIADEFSPRAVGLRYRRRLERISRSARR